MTPLAPDDLIDGLLAVAQEAANCDRVRLCWQASTEAQGYFRLWAQIPIDESIFDQLFNGRSGYRAQYYLSQEEGVLYNRQIVGGLVQAVRDAYQRRPLAVPFELVKRSMDAPHAKIWIYDEQNAFDSASPDILNPPRWAQNGASRGRRVPLPPSCELDLKGTFIHPETGKLYVDPLKLDRPNDLHNKGYT